jgi:hypothetical protein
MRKIVRILACIEPPVDVYPLPNGAPLAVARSAPGVLFLNQPMFSRQHRSNDPAVGYNRSTKYD